MTVLITGASRGIGRETALQFAEAGHQVWAVARSEAALMELVNSSSNIRSLVLDLNEIETASETISDALPELDLLVHNAAAFINKPFSAMQYSDMQSVYHTNVFVPYFLTQALLPKMNQGAQVLAISSVGGVGGSLKFPGLSVYSSSKGALNILVECLAEELKGNGISVNGLALGSSSTEMFKAAFPDLNAATTPAEMARFIVNFALNAPGMVNGKVYPVSSQNP